MLSFGPVRVVHLYGHHDARQHGLRLGVDECLATEGHLTFTEAFERLRVPRGLRFADRLSRRLLIRGLLLGGRGPRTVSGDDPRSVRAAQRAIDELRAAGVTAEHFKGDGPGGPLNPLLDLLTAYEKQLSAQGWEDDADRQREVIYSVSQGQLPSPYDGIERVVVHSVGDLLGPRLDLLSAFASRGIDVEVRIPFDADRRDGFAWPEASLHAIERRGHDSLRVVLDRRVGEGPLRELRAAQLGDGTAPGAPVVLLPTTHAAEHGRRVAALVAEWVMQGVPPDRIAIATPDPDGLGVEIERSLRRFGVAAHRRRGPSLIEGPVVRAVLEALHLEELGYPRETLIEVWQALVGVVEQPGERDIPATRVARLLRDCGARSTRIHDYGELLRDKAREHGRRRRNPDREHEAGRVAEAIDAFVERLRTLPSIGSVGQMFAAVQGFVDDQSVATRQRIFDHDDEQPIGWLLASQSRAPRARRSLSALLASMIQAAHSLPEELNQQMSRDELGRWLEVLAGETRLDPDGLRAASVSVGAAGQLVGTRFDRVVLAGIDAGVFPGDLAEDTVLSEPMRQQINRQLGPRLMQRSPMEGRGEVSAHARDRWLWLEAFAAAQDRVAVSFTVNPSSDNEGVSELVEDLGRCLELDPLGPGEPVYAAHRPVAIDHAFSMWAFGSLCDGARVAPVRAAGRAAALGEVLQLRYAQRAEGLLGRLQAEAAIASERRRVADLDEPRRRWLSSWLSGRVHSPSRLDQIGFCTFLFFARSVLRLEPERLEVLGADPREQGNVAHAALERVYGDLTRAGGLASARRDPIGTMSRARAAFDAARDQILAEASVHDLLTDAVLAEAWRVVRVQLEADLAAADGFEPMAFEQRFDEDPDAELPALVVPHPTGSESIRVRGSIDRIDRCGDVLRILDYKRTVKKRSAQRHFQLPLYAAAVANEFATLDLEVGWAAFRESKRTMLPPMSAQDAMQSIRSDLWQRLDRIVGGDVSPDPVDNSCDRCDVRALCRRDEARDGLRERGAG